MLKSLYSSQNIRLLAWLKKERTNQGLTMRALAAKLEVPHSFIGKVEQGERRLDVIEYIQYCQALKISPEAGIRAVTDK